MKVALSGTYKLYTYTQSWCIRIYTYEESNLEIKNATIWHTICIYENTSFSIHNDRCFLETNQAGFIFSQHFQMSGNNSYLFEPVFCNISSLFVKCLFFDVWFLHFLFVQIKWEEALLRDYVNVINSLSSRVSPQQRPAQRSWIFMYSKRVEFFSVFQSCCCYVTLVKYLVFYRCHFSTTFHNILERST